MADLSNERFVADEATIAPDPRAKRKRLLLILAVVVAVGAFVWGVWYILTQAGRVSTENAYVGADTAQVTPLVAGPVAQVRVANTQSVRKGDVLIVIDDADARIAVAEAESALAVAGVRTAQATRTAAGGELQSAQALVTRGDSPDVTAARARLRLARLNLDRTVIRAPIAGVVTNKMVQVGQRIAAGAPIMTLVPVDSAYVDANFKEDQLAHVRPGQTVELHSDFYGDDVIYRGRVVGFSGGTGAAFALIPAQNATGNWIKVVQRLPVRIAIEPAELREHPLRVGLSMHAVIDTRDR